jgi:hypothetical protein
MSRTIHFIIQGSQSALHKHCPYGYLHMNVHTDPQFFLHQRYEKFSYLKAWESITEEFGMELSVAELDQALHDEAFTGDELSIFQVTADEAAQWIEEAKVYSHDVD